MVLLLFAKCFLYVQLELEPEHVGTAVVVYACNCGVFQVISSRKPGVSLSATAWLILCSLVTAAGRIVWLLTVNVAPVAIIFVALAVPVLVLGPAGHMGDDEWDVSEQVPLCEYVGRGPANSKNVVLRMR